MKRGGTKRRVLAIDPTPRGFGFVVCEGADRLVDWGLRDIREDKEQRTIEKLEDLLHVYRPSILVVEDTADPTSRRSPRIVATIQRICECARSKRVAVRAFAPSKVRACFVHAGAKTKHQIAGVICRRFPELAPYQPPQRRIWMSEDDRMAIFDAAAFAATFYSSCE